MNLIYMLLRPISPDLLHIFDCIGVLGCIFHRYSLHIGVTNETKSRPVIETHQRTN